jgi:hypothetical protein
MWTRRVRILYGTMIWSWESAALKKTSRCVSHKAYTPENITRDFQVILWLLQVYSFVHADFLSMAR